MTITFKGGKLPPHDEAVRPVLKFGEILADPLPLPAEIDYISGVPDWPMYANDRYGDCVWAMIGHTIEAATRFGQGTAVKVAEEALLKAYHDVTGFDPNDPSTDQGTVIQDALDYWRKTGIGGHRILAFAKVDHTNHDELATALYLFGHLQLGIQFPASAMDQFNSGKPWTVVANDGGIEGGHAVCQGYELVGGASGYDSGVITWAKRQPMGKDFFDKYVEEAWVVITPEWYNAQGANPGGISQAVLGERFTALTGQPWPFPVQPAPTPTPQPPAPTPVVSPQDIRLARAMKLWLKAKGLE